jgi:hypothetical protein
MSITLLPTVPVWQEHQHCTANHGTVQYSAVHVLRTYYAYWVKHVAIAHARDDSAMFSHAASGIYSALCVHYISGARMTDVRTYRKYIICTSRTVNSSMWGSLRLAPIMIYIYIYIYIYSHPTQEINRTLIKHLLHKWQWMIPHETLCSQKLWPFSLYNFLAYHNLRYWTLY